MDEAVGASQIRCRLIQESRDGLVLALEKEPVDESLLLSTHHHRLLAACSMFRTGKYAGLTAKNVFREGRGF